MAQGNGRYGFPTQARLRHKREFQRVFARPLKSSDACFTVLAMPNDVRRPRLGLAISRKAARSAVARNRIKRTVRESFRHSQGELPGLDFVVMARPGLDTKDTARMRASLKMHWSRLSKRCAGS